MCVVAVLVVCFLFVCCQFYKAYAEFQRLVHSEPFSYSVGTPRHNKAHMRQNKREERGKGNEMESQTCLLTRMSVSMFVRVCYCVFVLFVWLCCVVVV